MKFYIRQKALSWRDRFTVTDEAGNVAYTVEGELFTWGKKLHVTDPAGNEALFISQRIRSFLHRYEVFSGGLRLCTVVREFTLLRPKYTVEGPGWTIDGNFWGHEYSIMNGVFPVARVSKAWMTWGDCYELEVYDIENVPAALAVVLVIDCVDASNTAAAAAAATT